MPESESGSTSKRRGRVSFVPVAERFGMPSLLVALIVFFSFYSTTAVPFKSSANLQNIFANQSVTGLIALGMIVPLVAGYFDLSVAAIAGLSSVTVAAVSGTHGQPVAIGVIAGILIALVAGAVNGFLVAIVRLNPFVTTFGTYILIGGMLEFYTKGNTIGNGLPASFGELGGKKILGIAFAFWLLIVIAIIAWYVLTQTPFGRRLAAIGSNESAARLAGFRVNRSVFIAFLLSALLAGLAGALLTSRTLGADSSTAQAYLFPSLAAVFLGQTAVRPGHYNVWGTMFGVFLIAIAVDGFTFMGAAAWVTDVFNGGALVASVAVSTLTSRAAQRRSRIALMSNVSVSTSPATNEPAPPVKSPERVEAR